MYVAGHLFTYDQKQFWSIIHFVPAEIESELKECSAQLKEKITAAPTTAAETVLLYHSCDRCWQKEYPEDELLTIRCLLRKVADAGIIAWD